MKYLATLASLTASLFLVGCTTTTPLITPAALTSDVSGLTKIGLDVYPAGVPDVALARDVICAAASSSTTSPDAIVADLAALNIGSSQSKLIVDGALFAYEQVYALLGTNATAQAGPYLTATCAGLTAGLPVVTPVVPVTPVTPAAAAKVAKSAHQTLPPHLK